jgi:hypothetical protein
LNTIERSSRYWVSAQAGHKDELLFQRGTQQVLWQQNFVIDDTNISPMTNNASLSRGWT